MDKGPNIRANTVKLLRENLGEDLYNLGFLQWIHTNDTNRKNKRRKNRLKIYF
jgi:hypothetical protein